MIDERQMTLATDLTSQWVGGWFWQEKIRDCRVIWDGRRFWTRSGAAVAAPAWFTRGLPRIRIDGGIWAGRQGFRTASNAVRLGGHWFECPELRFTPFDLPDMIGRWDRRQREAVLAIRGCAFAVSLPFGRVSDEAGFSGPTWNNYAGVLLRHARRGSEGVMFRNPDVEHYETGRTGNLLREKFTAA